MKKILGLLFLSILTVINPLVTDAAIITFLPNLDINGTSYDVTIHATGTYEDIWGSNPSSTTGLGSGGSLGSGPAFWNNGRNRRIPCRQCYQGRSGNGSYLER